MNFKQFEYFLTVAEAQSISKAARTLHVSQPPISRQIALLEDELGVSLFQRSNKGVKLTEAGRSLYRQGQYMFQNFQMMVDNVRNVNRGFRGLLKIGTIYSNTPIVIEYLRRYHTEYPQVELYVRMGSPQDLLDDLNKGNLHVLFLRSFTEEVSDPNEQIIGEDPLELVMRRELDPAPGQESVPVEALEGVPMCLLRSDDMWGYSSALVQECQRRGFSLNVVCQCYDTPMVMQLVQAGFGISCLPRSIVATQPGSGICSKPIQGMTTRSYPVLISNGSSCYANCVKQFLAMFQDGEAPCLSE